MAAGLAAIAVGLTLAAPDFASGTSLGAMRLCPISVWVPGAFDVEYRRRNRNEKPDG
jgi:hypothetical protein